VEGNSGDKTEDRSIEGQTKARAVTPISARASRFKRDRTEQELAAKSYVTMTTPFMQTS